MTKTVTHLDLDDVLNSIRRLVAVPDANAVAGDTPVVDPLVLTPSFRIMDKQTGDGLDLSRTPEQISEIVEDVQRRSDDEADRDGIAQDAEPKADVFELTQQFAVVEDVRDTPDQETMDDQRPAFSENVVQAPTSLESRIAELERAVGGDDEAEFEPDGSEPQEIHQPKLHFLERYRERFGNPDNDALQDDVIAHADGAADEAATSEPLTDDSDEDVATFATGRVIRPTEETGYEEPTTSSVDEIEARADDFEDEQSNNGAVIEDLAARLSQLRPVVEEPELTPETTQEAAGDDILEPEQASDAPIQLSDVATFTHSSRPEEPREVATAPEPQTTEVANDDDFLVDEEMLRNVVADIVRDELQGRLGERITRNVRRMVRQEIEKAIALKSLD